MSVENIRLACELVVKFTLRLMVSASDGSSTDVLERNHGGNTKVPAV